MKTKETERASAVTEPPRQTHRHNGHRKRMREKWKKGSYFEKHELLEMILFYSIPRANTNEIAHELLDRFGSLNGIMNASPEALTSVNGVGEETAFYISVLAGMIARYNEENVRKELLFSSYDELCAYVRTLYVGVSIERTHLLLFDSAGRLKWVDCVGEGFAGMSEVSMVKIKRLAVRYDATVAILSHNHPSGIMHASREDMITTKRIEEELSMLGVRLLDHIVVAGSECFSLMRKKEKA